jgi:hypothetical protein
MKLQGGSCKFQCDAGFYSDTENVCQPCHVACGTCTSPRNTTCGSCTSGYYLEWLGFACKFDCDDGKYGDSLTNMCLLCHYSCRLVEVRVQISAKSVLRVSSAANPCVSPNARRENSWWTAPASPAIRSVSRASALKTTSVTRVQTIQSLGSGTITIVISVWRTVLSASTLTISKRYANYAKLCAHRAPAGTSARPASRGPTS